MSTSEWEKEKTEKNSKKVLHLTSTPPLSKIRSAGILSTWQKETSSHIWTAIKFEYFDLTKIRFFEIPWFFTDFQQNFKFPDDSLQGIFFHHFPCFPCFPECVATLHKVSWIYSIWFRSYGPDKVYYMELSQGEIIQKPKMQEFSFLLMTHLLSVMHALVKFHEYISYGLGVMARTQLTVWN